MHISDGLHVLYFSDELLVIQAISPGFESDMFFAIDPELDFTRVYPTGHNSTQ